MPLELLTLLGSSIVGGFIRILGAVLQARRLQADLQLQILKGKADVVHQARTYKNKAFQWTRRIIALTSVFFIIAFPKILAVFAPDLAIHIGYTHTKPGFLFFTNPVEKVVWAHLKGLVITPLDTHLLSAIIGLYFGGSLIGNH